MIRVLLFQEANETFILGIIAYRIFEARVKLIEGKATRDFSIQEIPLCLAITDAEETVIFFLDELEDKLSHFFTCIHHL